MYVCMYFWGANNESKNKMLGPCSVHLPISIASPYTVNSVDYIIFSDKKSHFIAYRGL